MRGMLADVSDAEIEVAIEIVLADLEDDAALDGHDQLEPLPV